MSDRARAYVSFVIAVAIAVLVMVAVMGIHNRAKSHESPTGWKYPSNCCSDQDCRPVGCGTIRETRDGGASWTGLLFTKEQTKMSGDGLCHVCVGYDLYGHRYPHCIFLSPAM